MPVRFGIDSLHVSNFRGIETLSLDLPRGIPIYLLGGNNSGKSTVLNALALAFKGGGFDTWAPQEYDFHRKSISSPADKFTIEVRFTADAVTLLPAVQGVGNPRAVHGIRVQGERRDEGLVHRHHLLDETFKPIVYSPRTPIPEKHRHLYTEHGLGYRNEYARLDEIRKHLPNVWYLKPDNLNRSLYEWRAGPLQRLAQMLTENFIKTEWEYQHRGASHPMPSTMRNVHRFFSEATESFPFWAKELKPKLAEVLSRYVGRSASIELAPGIQPFEEWLTQQLALAFAASSGETTTPLRTLGDGWQALVRLAALETLVLVDIQRDYPVLLLFEEPETYLHPHLKRKLRDVLEHLAQRDWLVVCTTHSPEFISFVRPQQIVRLSRGSTGTRCGSVLTSSLTAGAHLQEKLDEYQSHEFLFARRVVLSEGKDDCYALALYFQKAHVDCDALAVSSIGLRGVGNIPDYAVIATALRIAWCALTDEDRAEDGTLKPNTVKAREKLLAIKTRTDIMPMWPISLEHCLKVPDGKAATPDWQELNVASKTLDELREAYPAYVTTCEQIVDWAQRADD